MKISNVTILSTNLTNNTAKISFTISEATENVNIYLKINDEEYKEIFSNKTNEDLEYTANISRGVNNLLLKATDSTTEYISEPIQVLLKEEPSIKNLKCSYSDSTGKYILNFAFNGDTNFKYNIYLKLDTNDYIEVLSNQISGDKTIEQTSAMGEHTCTLKVSDGYNDYTFSPFQFEITNHKPILSKVLVTDITNNGEAYIYYSTKDIESSTLTHKLTIGTTEKVITPTQVDNFYSYRVTGLSEGTSNCTISISDGTDIVSSDVFSIEVFSDTTDKKELLRRAKVRYDSAYQQLRDIIVSVISDLKYDYDIENALIAKAQDNYKIEYSNFNKISQQSIDAIGNNKVNVTKQELQSEINDVDNAVNSLETTMWGVFQDGVLDQSERDALSSSLDLVAKEKIDIDKDYEALYNNEDLIDPAKTKLQTNYNTFIEAHNSLATTINNIINKEGIIDNTDKTNIDTAFENWRTALGNYRTASLEAIDAIAKKKADDSADVVDKKWAEIVLDPETGIQTQVGSLQSKITGANGIEERLRTAEQTLTPDGITTIIKDNVYIKDEISEQVSSASSSLTQTVNGFEARVSQNENDIASLKLTNEEFEVAIGNKADSSNIISVINASTESITISSSKVNISGFVTFSDLRNPNSYTTIHGSNIATKTISASDISTGTLTGCLLQTYSDSANKGVRILKDAMALGNTSFTYYSADQFRIYSKENVALSSYADIYLMPKLNSLGNPDGTGYVVIPNSTLRAQGLVVVGTSEFGGNISINGSVGCNSLSVSTSITSGDISSTGTISAVTALNVTNGGISTTGNITTSGGNLNAKSGYVNCKYLSVSSTSSFKGTITAGSISASSLTTSGNVKAEGVNCAGMTCSGSMSVDGTAWIATLYVNGNYVTSDETLKTDIKYVNMDTQELTEDGLMSPNVNITTSDMHQFIETLPMVSYRLIEDVEKGEDNTYYGFLAQEILYTKVGSELIKIPNDNEKELIGDKLRYSENKFIAFICGALQEEIKQRKALERQLNDLINTINK